MIEERFFKAVDKIRNILIRNGYSDLSKDLTNAAYGNIMPSEVFGETEIIIKKIKCVVDKNEELDKDLDQLLKFIDKSFRDIGDR